MNEYENLKENTWLHDRYLPMNVFCNTCQGHDVLGIHWHQYIEIIYMLQGMSAFNIGGTHVNAGPGDIIFVNSGMLHSGISICDETVRYYAIVIDPALLSSQTPDPGHAKYVAPFLENQRRFPLFIPKMHENHRIFEELILNVAREFLEKPTGYETMVRTYLNQLIITVVRHFYPGDNSSNSSEIYYRNIDSIKWLISYIEKHYTEKITVEEAARLVNISPYHFCRVFKKITGRTLIEFVNLYRIKKAEELIKGTQLPMTDIAEKAGFCNINYFDRVFRKMRKYPPSSCRK